MGLFCVLNVIWLFSLDVWKTVQVLVLKWEFCPNLAQMFFKTLQYEMAPGPTELLFMLPVS